MRNTWVKLPVPTGDVSGAASALYELGGMLVIHDPSGCNSTYNTHDELRWYDKESLIFISGLTDIEAANGDDSRLIRDTVEAAEYYRPRFIAFANSPIPYLNGTDFAAICRLVEQKCQIPCFYVETNAMHDYAHGASLAFLRFAQKLLPDEKPARRPDGRLRVAVLGMTPLDFPARTDARSLKAILEASGFAPVCCWSVDTDFEEAMQAVEADVSLVVSTAGLRTAVYLKERYGIPYVVGLPVGRLREPGFEAVRAAAAGTESRPVYLNYENRFPGGRTLTVVGEPVTMGSVGAAIALREGWNFRIAALTEDSAALISDSDAAAPDEESLTAALSDAALVLGDPFYRRILPPHAELRELSHFALSGRLYLDRVQDIFEEVRL